MKRIASAAFLAAAAPLHAWAAAGGGHGEENHASIADLLFPAINFALFVALFYKFAWPAIRTSLAERRRDIESGIAEANRASKEAHDELASIRELRDGQSKEAAELLDQVRAEAEAAREKMIANARAAAERIREDAGRQGEQEMRRAGDDLRARLAGSIVDAAGEKIRARTSEAHQAAFIAHFVERVGAEDRA